MVIASSLLCLLSVIGAQPGTEASTLVMDNCLISAFKKVDVPAAEPGVIMELNQSIIGKEVAKDFELGKLDISDALAKKKSAMYEREIAKAQAASDAEEQVARKTKEVAERELASAKDANIRVRGTVTANELNRLQLTVDRAGFEIEIRKMERENHARTILVKEAQLDAANNEIGRRTIKAPLTGVVTEILKHEGEWAQPGETLLKVVGLDQMRVIGFVPHDKYATSSIRGSRVKVTALLPSPNGGAPIVKEAQGVITFVSPQVESSGDYRVWAEIENQRDPATGEYVFHSGAIGKMEVYLNTGTVRGISSAVRSSTTK